MSLWSREISSLRLAPISVLRIIVPAGRIPPGGVKRAGHLPPSKEPRFSLSSFSLTPSIPKEGDAALAYRPAPAPKRMTKSTFSSILLDYLDDVAEVTRASERGRRKSTVETKGLGARARRFLPLVMRILTLSLGDAKSRV